MHNIVPEIGELNALRSNYQFGVLPQVESGQFGACDIKINHETRQIEPCLAIRGMIARTYLYMAHTYNVPLSRSQRQLFIAWNIQYPPQGWEITRDERIANIQGNHNRYILNYSALAKYQDEK